MKEIHEITDPSSRQYDGNISDLLLPNVLLNFLYFLECTDAEFIIRKIRVLFFTEER